MIWEAGRNPRKSEADEFIYTTTEGGIIGLEEYTDFGHLRRQFSDRCPWGVGSWSLRMDSAREQHDRTHADGKDSTRCQVHNDLRGRN